MSLLSITGALKLILVMSECKSLTVCQISVKAVIYASLNLCRFFFLMSCLCHICAGLMCETLFSFSFWYTLMFKFIHEWFVQRSWHRHTIFTQLHACIWKPLSLSHSASDLLLTSWTGTSTLQSFKTKPQAQSVKQLGSHQRQVGTGWGGMIHCSYVLPDFATFSEPLHIHPGCSTISCSVRDGGIKQWRLACEPEQNAFLWPFGYATVFFLLL